jgi:phage-related protein
MGKLLTFEPLRRLDGSSEFEEFLASLPIKDRAKLLSVIDDTEIYGLAVAISQQWIKKLRDGIFELRSRHGSDIQRALYFQDVGTHYVITHGFTKKSNRTPEHEIDRARKMMREYRERKSP